MRARVRGINLLPRQYIQEERERKLQIVVGALVVFEIIVFIACVALPPKFEKKEVEALLVAVNTQLEDVRYDDVYETLNELETAKTEIEQWLDKYGGLKTNQFIGGRVLDSLTSRLPLGAAITNIEIKTDDAEGKTIEIKGVADTVDSILSYAKVLEQTYGAVNVTSEATYDEGINKSCFTLSVILPVEVPEVEEPLTTSEPPVEEEEGETDANQ